MTLAEAIAAVEADGVKVTNTGTAQQSAQDKFSTAQAALTQATTDQVSAITAFNTDIDNLITAATAAKLPVPSAS